MKILVLAERKEGIPVEQLRPLFKAEIEAVWNLYTAGIVREFFARADRGGPAILTVESESVEAAQKALAALPMVERKLINLDFIPLAPFANLNQLFQEAN